MALRAATVHENFVFVLERLCQLSRLGRFCQFQDLIDFTDKTLMALKPPLVPGSEFQVSICGSDSNFELNFGLIGQNSSDDSG